MKRILNFPGYNPLTYDNFAWIKVGLDLKDISKEESQKGMHIFLLSKYNIAKPEDISKKIKERFLEIITNPKSDSDGLWTRAFNSLGQRAIQGIIDNNDRFYEFLENTYKSHPSFIDQNGKDTLTSISGYLTEDSFIKKYSEIMSNSYEVLHTLKKSDINYFEISITSDKDNFLDRNQLEKLIENEQFNSERLYLSGTKNKGEINKLINLIYPVVSLSENYKLINDCSNIYLESASLKTVERAGEQIKEASINLARKFYSFSNN